MDREAKVRRRVWGRHKVRQSLGSSNPGRVEASEQTRRLLANQTLAKNLLRPPARRGAGLAGPSRSAENPATKTTF